MGISATPQRFSLVLDQVIEGRGRGPRAVAGAELQQVRGDPRTPQDRKVQILQVWTRRMSRFERRNRIRDAVEYDGQFIIEAVRRGRRNGADPIGF